MFPSLDKLNISSNNQLYYSSTSHIYTIARKKFLSILGLNLSPNDFRHNLGQSLADQGASAESIAEILGHNSLVAGRAYIKATPKIAELKTRALGKNKNYKDIMSMLMTGEIIERKSIAKNHWVKGIVGTQYIGEIGGCGLSHTTPCPKNPIYACYTCKKFMPFKDGIHESVILRLQEQAQKFIDVAESSQSLKNNRTYVQLEESILSVQATIERIKNI